MKFQRGGKKGPYFASANSVKSDEILTREDQSGVRIGSRQCRLRQFLGRAVSAEETG
jgi:hypothetical protein